MVRINIESTWNFTSETSPLSMRVVISFLSEIQATGTLASAADQAGMSYRHAWNLVDKWASFFGEPLVTRHRGKGTQLTPLGSKLVWADQHLRARLGPQLHNIARELEAELASLVPHTPPRIRMHAYHGFAISRVGDLLAQEPEVQIDLRYMSNQAALESLAARECEIAAVHLPHGALRKRAAASFRSLLDPKLFQAIGLATRQIGLMVKQGNPKQIHDLEALRNEGISIVNRDQGSGTRLLFDNLLAQSKIDGRLIAGYQRVETTHSAVAANVARDMADAGFGVRAAAVQFNLDFVHLVTEDCFFVCRQPELRSPSVQRLIGIIRDKEYRASIETLPGFTVTDAGMVRPLQAFLSAHV